MTTDLQKQINALQKQIANLEKRISSFETKGKPKVKREPSEYNRFMSTEGPKIKAQNPGIKQADVMKLVAQKWREQK